MSNLKKYNIFTLCKMRFYSLIIEIIQFILLPILKRQGHSVRESALKLPEAKGPRFGVKGFGDNLNLLIIGDSSACGVGVNKIEQSLAGFLIENLKTKYKCNWKIIAQSGLKTHELIKILENENLTHFEVVVISIGMNDITSGISREKWLTSVRILQELLKRKFSVSQLIFSGMPPVDKIKAIPQPLRIFLTLKAKLFDASLRIFCLKNQGNNYLSINSSFELEMFAIDGFHPNEKFYELWASMIINKFQHSTK